MNKSKPIKEKVLRKDFAQRLAVKLRPLGNVDEGALSDSGGRWVCLKVGKLSIHFSFDMKGEFIDSVGFYQEVWEMVDEKQIISFDLPKNKN